ncbi:hypothetical protein SDC9_64585 [bioreactor metagenome]|uniref:Uncharacterized protein n=1 Tax=bioreactor metagenome TaxID=1076179 RepID=A0A644XPV5_9ZZZZ
MLGAEFLLVGIQAFLGRFDLAVHHLGLERRQYQGHVVFRERQRDTVDPGRAVGIVEQACSGLERVAHVRVVNALRLMLVASTEVAIGLGRVGLVNLRHFGIGAPDRTVPIACVWPCIWDSVAHE